MNVLIVFDHIRLINKLQEEFKYSKEEAKNINERIANIHVNLQESLNLWINENRISTFSFEGITFDFIMKKKNTNFINSVFTMSTLIKNPDMIEHFKQMFFLAEDVFGKEYE